MQTAPGYAQPSGVTAVYVYSFNDTSTGPVSVSLLHDNGSGSVQTDANGNGYVTPGSDGSINVSGLYEAFCPTPNSHIYMVALGVSNGTYNSASALMALMPVSCSQFDNLPSYSINEATTVAAAYGLTQAGFTLTASSNGVLVDSLTGPNAGDQTIDNAFAYAANFVDATTGNVQTQTPVGGAAVPTTTVNSLSNILVDCTYSTNGASGSDCQGLFQAATVASSVPYDTIQVAFNIAANPTNNTSALYTDSQPQQIFTPGLSSAPSIWTLPLSFSSALSTSIVVGLVNDSSVKVGVEDTNGVVPTGSLSCTLTDANNNVSNFGPNTIVYGGTTLSLPQLPSGTNTLSCNYSPTGNFSASSVAVPLIGGKNYGSQITLSTIPTNVTVGQSYSLRAVVNVTSGGIVQPNLFTTGTLTCNGATASVSDQSPVVLSETAGSSPGSTTFNCNFANGSSQPSGAVSTGPSPKSLTVSWGNTSPLPSDQNLNSSTSDDYGLIIGGVSGRPGPGTAVYNGYVFVAYTATNDPFPYDPAGDNDQYVYIDNPFAAGTPPYPQPARTNVNNNNPVAGDGNPSLLSLDPAQTANGPANPLYLAEVSDVRESVSGSAAMYEYRNGQWTFSPGQFFSNIQNPVDYSPSLASDGQWIYMAVRNQADHTMVLCRETVIGEKDQHCTYFPGSRAMNFNPVLTVFNGVLFIGFEEYDNTHELRIFTSVDQGLTIQENTDISSAFGGDQTSAQPSFAWLTLSNGQKQLYIGFRSNDGSVHFLYRSSLDGFHWDAMQDTHYSLGINSGGPVLFDATQALGQNSSPSLWNFFAAGSDDHLGMQFLTPQ